MKNLGNFPIHIRQDQKWKTPNQNSTENVSSEVNETLANDDDITKIADLDFSVINKDDIKNKIKQVSGASIF